MIKICFVTTISGSMDSFILPLIPALEKNRFQVSLVTACADGFRERCPKTVAVYDFPVKRGFDFPGTFRAAKRFYALCKKERFDMVVYSTPNGALYGSIGSRLAKVPCRILWQWGMRYVGFQGFIRRVVCNLEKISCRCATDVRNVSHTNRNIAIKDGMYPPEKCKVLGEGGTIGIDLSNYRIEEKEAYRNALRSKYHIPDETVIYGFVGRICRDKGIRELMEAFRKLHGEHPNTVLLFLGKIDDEDASFLSMIESEQQNPAVIFHPPVLPDEVVSVMSAMDVLVLPTYREGFVTVLQESQAMAIASVTTDVPGAAEVLENGVTGLVAKPHDAESLCQAMKRLMDEGERNCMGRAGRKRVEDHYERTQMIEKICEDYLMLYQKRVGK